MDRFPTATREKEGGSRSRGCKHIKEAESEREKRSGRLKG